MTPMPLFPRYRFDPRKAIDGITFLLKDETRFDAAKPLYGPIIELRLLLIACYLADKHHLNTHGRPVFGATYRALPSRPHPIEIYEVITGEPLWLAEAGYETTPWRLDHTKLDLIFHSKNPALDNLSETDKESLLHGLKQALTRDFSPNAAELHGPDWQRARLGEINYLDMVDEDNPNKISIREAIVDSAHLLHL